MNKLTAEKSKEQFEEWFKGVEIELRERGLGFAAVAGIWADMWKAWRASRQALEIALPILEQQEQKEKVTLRDGLAALSAHIDSIGGYNFEALEAYRREEFGQQQRGEGEWIEWGGGECPVSGETGVSVKFRNGETSEDYHPAGIHRWHHDSRSFYASADIIAYRIIPEQQRQEVQSDLSLERENFEISVMEELWISKATLEGLRTEDGYRNSTLSGRDYNGMWKAWILQRKLQPTNQNGER